MPELFTVSIADELVLGHSMEVVAKKMFEIPLQTLQLTEHSLAPAVRSSLLKKQMPGLDMLRGIAVLAVVCYHGMSWGLPHHNALTFGARSIVSLTSSGRLGVNLFFILSGFLITGIRLDTKSKRHYWKNFYVRRVLRILPL